MSFKSLPFNSVVIYYLFIHYLFIKPNVTVTEAVNDKNTKRHLKFILTVLFEVQFGHQWAGGTPDLVCHFKTICKNSFLFFPFIWSLDK